MRPSPKQPTITLGAGGLIGLNAAVTRNILGESKFALLLFDRAKSLIGIKFLDHNEPDAYPIKVVKTKSHAALTGTSFMKTYGIYPTETRSYQASFDERNRILFADVSELGEAAKAAQRKGKA